MPTAAELLATAQSAAAPPPTAAGGAKRPCLSPEASQARMEEQDVVTKLMRLSLLSHLDARDAKDAKSVVFLVADNTWKQAVKHQMDRWQQQRPQVTDEHRKTRNFPTHLLGDKMVLISSTMMQKIVSVAPKGSPPKKAAEALLGTDTAILRRAIQSFRPRFPTYREDRQWKFELVLTDFATPEFKEAIVYLWQLKVPHMRIEKTHGVQTGLEKELWDLVKQRQASRQG